MKRQDNRIYIDAIKMVGLIVLSMALCRFTNGIFALVVASIGIFCALMQKIGPAICCYVFLPLCIVTNPILIPKGGAVWSIALRFGPLAIGCALAIGAVRRTGRHALPFAGIIPFLLVAIVSSIGGYVPQISYLKLINYFVFLIGIWLGTRNMQHFPKDLQIIRAFFLGMIFLWVWGSLALIPMPAVSYATSLRYLGDGIDFDSVNALGKEMLAAGGKTLFCGVTNHSQALSPVLALSMGWLLCDMLFFEKRFRLPHVITIVAMLPMLYMTRSRVALLTGASVMAILNFYTVNRVRVSSRVKGRLRTGMIGFCLLAMALAGVAEIRDQSITKWIRKTDDLAMDERSTAEALTGSRQSLMEESLYDFRRNPLWGSGFQVSWNHIELYRQTRGLILSASIEKGVLPVMVLGETGIIGSIAFVVFLLSFYLTCNKRRLYVTSTMFTLLLVSNMGEATFFSPGGTGGVLWILTVLGGFVIDTVLLYERTVMGRQSTQPFSPARYG